MKPLTASLLTAALVALPTVNRAQQQPSPDPKLITAIECAGAATIIVLGTYLTLRVCGAYRHWKDPIEMTSAPLPTMPPVINPNPPVTQNSIAHLAISGPVASIPITSGSLMDTNGAAPVAFTNYAQFALQRGSELSGFADLFHFSIWQSPAGSLVQVNDSSDRPLWTSYSSSVNGHATNSIPLWIGTGQEPQQFFRLLSN